MERKYSKIYIVLLAFAAIASLSGAIYYLNSQTAPAEQGEISDSSGEVSTGADGGKIIDGIDVATGFVAEGDYILVKASCTPCHSAKLVTQNRATREGWLEMIRWMQETQKLWDLQPNEDKILDYLARHYAPENEGRRRPLEVEEWYVIE